MRRFAAFLRRLVFVLVLVAATLYAATYFVMNSPRTADAVRKRLAIALPHATVRLGGIDVAARPFGASVHEVELFDPDGARIGEVRHVALDIAPWSLFGDTTRVRHLIIDGFDLNLVWDADGRLNLEAALQPPPPDPDKPVPPVRPPRPTALERLVLANGTLRFAADPYEIVLTGVGCDARVDTATKAKGALSCRIESGKVRVAREGEEPIELPIANVELSGVSFTSEESVVLEDVTLMLDNHPVQLSLNLEKGGGLVAVPKVGLRLNGAFSARAPDLLTGGMLKGAATVEMRGHNQGLDVELNIVRLTAVGPLVIASPEDGADDLLRAAGLDITGLRVQAGSKGLFLRGAVKLEELATTALQLEKAGVEGSFNVNLRPAAVFRAARGDMDALLSIDALAKVDGHVERAEAGRLVASGVPLEVPDFALERGSFEFENDEGRFQIWRAGASLLQVADHTVNKPSLSADLRWSESTLSIETIHVTTEDAGVWRFRGEGTLDMEAQEQRLPFRVTAEVTGLPGAKLTAYLEAGFRPDVRERAELHVLFNGTVGGEVVLAGGVLPFAAPEVVDATLRVRRANDNISISLAAPASDTPAAAYDRPFAALDSAQRTLRIGDHVFTFDLQPHARTR